MTKFHNESPGNLSALERGDWTAAANQSENLLNNSRYKDGGNVCHKGNKSPWEEMACRSESQRDDDDRSGRYADGGEVDGYMNGGNIRSLMHSGGGRVRQHHELAMGEHPSVGYAHGGALQAAAKKLKHMGRDGDTDLVHVNEQEKQMLKAAGGRGSVNPKTGLKEYTNSGSESDREDNRDESRSRSRDKKNKFPVHRQYNEESEKREIPSEKPESVQPQALHAPNLAMMKLRLTQQKMLANMKNKEEQEKALAKRKEQETADMRDGFPLFDPRFVSTHLKKTDGYPGTLESHPDAYIQDINNGPHFSDNTTANKGSRMYVAADDRLKLNSLIKSRAAQDKLAAGRNYTAKKDDLNDNFPTMHGFTNTYKFDRTDPSIKNRTNTKYGRVASFSIRGDRNSTRYKSPGGNEYIRPTHLDDVTYAENRGDGEKFTFSE